MKQIVDEFKEEFELTLAEIRQCSAKLAATEFSQDREAELRTFLIRAAAPIEQCFSGLTTRLWDDPFEWTLPEYISDQEKFDEYLGEVEDSLDRGFRIIRSDAELTKTLPAPEKMKTVFQVLLSTLIAAKESIARFESGLSA